MKTRDMKTLFKIMALFLMLFSFTACDDDEEATLTRLEVTPANLDGTWKLVEWNGAPLQEGSYCYITFSRKDKTYKMYDKFNSMYASLKTGSFSIETDKYLGFILTGDYDFGNGKWNNAYIVTDLLATGSMIWTVKDNPEDVQKFEKCIKVPDEVENEVRQY